MFDFCGNLEYFSQDLPETNGSTQRSLTQRLVEGRLHLLQAIGDNAPEVRARTAALLHEFVSGMNLDNVVVRRNRALVERFSDDVAWEWPRREDLAAAVELAGLPSAARDDDEFAKRIDLIILQRQLAQLEGDALNGGTCSRDGASDRRVAAREVEYPDGRRARGPARVGRRRRVVDGCVDRNARLARLRLRGLARFIDRVRRSPVYTDFEDTLSEGVEVALGTSVTGTDIRRFRDKARAFLRTQENHMSMQRLRRNLQLTESDLSALQGMLVDAQIASPVEIEYEATAAGGLGLFIRSLVGLDRPAATEAFSQFLDSSAFSVQQIRFVELVIDELTATGVMEPSRLFQRRISIRPRRGQPDCSTTRTP